MSYIIVNYVYNPPLTDEALNSSSAALSPCLEMRGVRRLRTYLSTDRKRGFCEFVAADAETVREAFHSAKVPYDSLWSADLYGPP